MRREGGAAGERRDGESNHARMGARVCVRVERVVV